MSEKMDEVRLCPYCGTDMIHKRDDAKHCGSTRCKGKHRRKMHGKEIDLKCAICGKTLTKGQSKYCSEACIKRNKSIQAAKRYKMALRDDKLCMFCHKPIPRNLTNWWQRISCDKPQCEEKRLERIKSQKKEAVRKHREKITAIPTVGVPKQYLNKKDPEYWDHEMYLKKQQESKKKNGWVCRVCGVALTGDERFFCKIHHNAVSAIAGNGNYDDNYAYM